MRQRDLLRQAKEMAKLSAQQAARLEVESHENAIELLVSVHKGETECVDWRETFQKPPPLRPVRLRAHELRAQTEILVRRMEGSEAASQAITAARATDDRTFQAELTEFEAELSEWENLRRTALGVIDQQPEAYGRALVAINPFEELAVLGSELHFRAHSATVLEVGITSRGSKAIPPEAKSLGSAGKVLAKAMPRAKYQELYQDYMCSCAIRVAREVFGLLPVEVVIVTSSAEILDPGTGVSTVEPVLSIAFEKCQLAALDLERIDPSSAVQRFQHRGDLSPSRKQESFRRISPLTISDLPSSKVLDGSLEVVLSSVRSLRSGIAEALRYHANGAGKTHPQADPLP